MVVRVLCRVFSFASFRGPRFSSVVSRDLGEIKINTGFLLGEREGRRCAKHVRICHSMAYRNPVLGPMGRSSKGGKVPSSGARVKSIFVHHVKRVARGSSRTTRLISPSPSRSTRPRRRGRSERDQAGLCYTVKFCAVHSFASCVPRVCWNITCRGIIRLERLRFAVVKAKNHTVDFSPRKKKEI